MICLKYWKNQFDLNKFEFKAMRTRAKICGITRPQDIQAAVQAGVDAIGFVFYEPSPRYVTIELAQQLAQLIPPYINIVGLFVNASAQNIAVV